MAARVPPEGVPGVARHDRADVAQRPLQHDRLPGHQLLLGAEEEARPQQPRRGGPRAAQDLRQARHPARRTEDPVRRRRRRGVRLGVGRDDLPRGARREGHHLLLVQRGRARPPRAGEEVPRLGRAVHGQLLCLAQLGRLQRRQLRLHPQGRALPDGAEHLLPHQRVEHRPVRAHADHRRGSGLRELSRRLHGADARREPAARGGGRTGGARRGDHQVLDRPELVPGRQGRQRRHLQLRHQARRVPRQAARRSRGRRWKPARPSRGSTRAAC